MIKAQTKSQKMKKTKLYKAFQQTRTMVLAVVLSGVLLLGGIIMPRASANNIQDEIQALQEENENNSRQVANLMEVASSYEDAIGKLRGEIGYLQGKINHNLAQQAKLKKQIKQAQIELARQRKFLGEYIKAMYVDDAMSTIEMLATSKDLSEFVDKDAYRNAAQRQVQDTLKKVTKLQSDLKVKQERVDRLLREQQAEQGKLRARQAEQQQLLSANQQKRNEFNARTARNDDRIAELIAQQRAANNSTDGGYYFLRFPGAVRDFSPGGYPYKNAGFSMQLGPCSHTDSWPDEPDAWGYCTRQCVSYAAWAVGASGRDIPMYYGSAKYWVGQAYSNGVPVHRSPQKGDIAISTSGTWGHAMYVEAVEGDQIYVSQYNAGLSGEFSYQWRNWQ